MSVGNYQDSRDKPSTYIDRDPITEATSRFMAVATRLPTLFDLDDRAYELLTGFENADAATEADTEAHLALVDQMIVEKTESYVSVIRSLEKMAEARKGEADRLRDRAKTAEAQADWLKARLLVHMQTTNRPRIETARFTLAIRQNPPSVNVLDAAAVPSDYQRTKIDISVDKRAILEHFKATGELVDGIEITRGESLRLS